MNRREVIKGAAAAASTLAFPAVLRAQGAPLVSLRMQGFLAAASPTHRAFEKFVADLKTETRGRLAISFLPVGGAVAPTETLNAISNGILDGHYSAPSFFAARDPAFALLGDTGASYDTVEMRDTWFRSGGAVNIAREVYDKYGLHYVDQVFWPSEHIPAKKALNGVDDLRGLKIRVPPGMIAEVIGRVGASVVNLPGGEVFNALQSGVIDAADWASPGQNLEVGLYRAAKFSVAAAHSMPTTEVSFNKKKWASIPKDLQFLIQTSLQKMSGELQKQIKADDEKALVTMREQGVQIITWRKEEVAKLRQVTRRVQQEFGARNALARKVYDSLRGHQIRLGVE
jgi:TRAP-type mannitol/chloroaromatic compound transport system substrate-binding protein